MSRDAESGNVLVIVMLVLLLLTAIGAGLIAKVGMEIDLAGNQKAGEAALYIADAGVAEGLRAVQDDPSKAPTSAEDYTTVISEDQGIMYASAGYEVGAKSAGLSGNARYMVEARLVVLDTGAPVECNIPGYDASYGRQRYQVRSTGMLFRAGQDMADSDKVAYATRAVEAILGTTPQAGLCPVGSGEYP